MKLAALLLASSSMLGVAQAQADATSPAIANLKVADAYTPSSTEETVRVTADEQGAGSGGGSATSNVGTVDVQGAGAGQALGSGYIVPEDGPKERSTVTQAGIQNMLPSVNPYQIISLLPGVNQFQDDAIGLSGGTIRVRGLTAAQMGFTVNGVPFNDSNSFAVFPQEIIDGENIGQMWVTQGSTDIDAPHVGASGGNIGIVSRLPSDNFNVEAEGGLGDLGYIREFVSMDTGWIGDFKGFVSYSHTEADKWRGTGRDDRNHSDSNFIWQILPHSTIGLTWDYNDGLNDNYRTYTSSTVSGDSALQAFNAIGGKFDYDSFWGSTGAPINLYGPNSSANCATNASPSCTVANPFGTAVGTTTVANAFSLQLNPFRNAIATLPVNIQLTDNLRWETNPYIWWGQGNSGFGTTTTVGGIIDGFTVPSLYGAPAGDKVLIVEESVNKTFRPGFTTKFVYDWDNYTFAVGGWLEHSLQTNTEPVSLVNPNATPCDPYLTQLGNNKCAVTGNSAFGLQPIEVFDDRVNSIGQAAFVQAQGRFLDDALKVFVGLSDRDINRSVHNQQPVCADDPALTNVPGSATTCVSVANTTAFTQSSAFNVFGGPTIGATAAYAAMRAYAQNPHVNFNKVLPELNATFDIDTFQQLFLGVSSGFRTPNTLNFEQFNSAGTVAEITNIKPETSRSYEAGYRYHGDFLTASTDVFLQDVQDYQASVQIDPVDFITSNIGGVKIYGIDAEAGTKPWHGFTFYASAELENSVLSDNVAAETCGSSIPQCTTAQKNAGIQLFVHTQGKQLVDTPNWIVSTSIGYEQDGFFGSIEPHCYGQRATSLLNDEFVPANCTVNATAGYHINKGYGSFKDATLQLYAMNLFDSKYLGQITTQGQTNTFKAPAFSPTAPGQVFTVGSESYSAKPGSPLFIGVKLVINIGH
jgi:iron complex outermembrane receptor protein